MERLNAEALVNMLKDNEEVEDVYAVSNSLVSLILKSGRIYELEIKVQ